MERDAVEAVVALSSEGVAVDLTEPSELPEGARLDWANATDYAPGLLPGTTDAWQAECAERGLEQIRSMAAHSARMVRLTECATVLHFAGGACVPGCEGYRKHWAEARQIVARIDAEGTTHG